MRHALAGLAVVAAIFISACVAAYESILRLIHPSTPSHLLALALAGAIGFASNERLPEKFRTVRLPQMQKRILTLREGLARGTVGS